MENRFLYPQVVADSLENYNATGFAGVSSHYNLLMQQTDFLKRTLPKLRYFQHAGDKMPVAVTRQLLDAFGDKELYLMYGQTEAAPRLSYLQPTKTRAKSGSVGQAIPGVQIRIVQDDGAECPVGEEGNLIAFGPNVMQGYWKHPEETAEVLKNGWLHTGDIAYVDADGDLCITGRKKQFLKVGGRRIRPGEIERVCQEHPEISEAAVIGVPDDVLGQRIKLFVSTTADVNKEELTLFFRKRLPSYMIPVETVIMEQLPKKSNGKVDKKKLA